MNLMLVKGAGLTKPWNLKFSVHLWDRCNQGIIRANFPHNASCQCVSVLAKRAHSWVQVDSSVSMANSIPGLSAETANEPVN